MFVCELVGYDLAWGRIKTLHQKHAPNRLALSHFQGNLVGL